MNRQRHFYISTLLCTILLTACHSQTLSVSVSPLVPPGWLVLDLPHQGLIQTDEGIFLQNSREAPFFTTNNHSQLVTSLFLESLRGKTFPIYILTQRPPFKRSLTVDVTVPEDPVEFTSLIYTVRIRSDLREGSVLPGDLRLSTKTRAVFHSLSPIHHLPIHIVTKNWIDGSYAQLVLRRPIAASDPRKFSIYVSATPNESQSRAIASCRVDIHIETIEVAPPKFEAEHYFTTVPTTPPFANVIRVYARSKGIVAYRVDPESAPFDVSPYSGDVFTTTRVSEGKHKFHVVARDAIGQESRASVVIAVDPTLAETKKRKQRFRRDPEELKLFVRENQPLGLLDKKVPLFVGERITLAPIVKEFLTVREDGSLQLTKPLNYEKTKDVHYTIQIDNSRRSRVQTIHLVVVDVDEPPAFVNGPKPYLAVVPLDRPIGFHVYKFVALDESGDGDANVEYKLINTEPPGYFTVDPESGVVRTAVKKFKSGETYRVFVQATDRTPTDNTTSQDSEVAVLEILAGDRPPQFAKQQYSVAVPEDTHVDYSVVDVRAHRFRPIDERRSKGDLSYHVYANAGGDRAESLWFGIGESDGVLHLKRPLDYDDAALPRQHKLFVVAREDNRESSVPVDVSIVDVNDNQPEFSRPLYTAQVKEDIAIGTVILKVEATDKDADSNARVRYSLSDGNFSINQNGEISPKVRLDADQNKERFFIYRFNVTATDGGQPALSSTAMKGWSVKNDHVVFVAREGQSTLAPAAMGAADEVRAVKRAKKKENKKVREKLTPGVVIPSEKSKYTVIKLLGSGGFGDVYLVDYGAEKKYAMKTEENSSNKMMLRLKMEVLILSACAKASPERRRHFVEYLDRGITPKFKFVIMGLVGPSVEDIRKKIVCDNFSSSTAIRICQQTLQSIWDLHDVGFIHRDIKACNFAVGLDPEAQGTIYMLDFGIARAWCEKNTKAAKVPRSKVKFLGTVRYCSRACHRLKDQGRKDDVESWLYMCLDVYDDSGLPWRLIPTRDDVLEAKEKFMKNLLRCYRLLPKEFMKIVTYVDGLQYADEPDYKYIFELLDALIQSRRINVDKPFDWAGEIGKERKKGDDSESNSNKLSGSDSDEEDGKKKKASSPTVTAKSTKEKCQKSSDSRVMPKSGKSQRSLRSKRRSRVSGGEKKEEKREKKRKQKKEREKLKPGITVASETHKYQVLNLLGSGGFGDVYLVDKGDEKKYALKTEMNDCNPAMARLKFETDILVALNKADGEHKKYFVPYIDRGQADKFRFMVMGLVGPSLDDIRKKILDDGFRQAPPTLAPPQCLHCSKSTAIRVCQQSLRAVSDFHEAGYLHRDIKPCNFAVGVEKDAQSTVYMLDFGIARKWSEGHTKTPKKAREKVKFLGTIRFCSRACHQLKEQGRKDDVEAWIYMCLDVFDDIGLPWKLMAKREDVAEAKDKFFKLGFKCFKIFPKEFRDIIKYVDGLKFEDAPDYAKIHELMDQIVKAHRINVNKPFDWDGKIKEKKGDSDSNKSDDISGSGSDEDSVKKKKKTLKDALNAALTSHKSQVRKKSSKRKSRA